MVTNFYVMQPRQLIMLYHPNEVEDGGFARRDFYDSHSFLLCPECIDRLTLFESYVDHTDESQPRALKLRSGRSFGGASKEVGR